MTRKSLHQLAFWFQRIRNDGIRPDGDTLQQRSLRLKRSG
jgi:hypothetical protein